MRGLSMESADRLPPPPRLHPAEPEPQIASAVLRCQRCRKPVVPGGLEIYVLELGLCYWCAHVDSQG